MSLGLRHFRFRRLVLTATLLAALTTALSFAGAPLRADEDEHDFEQALEAGEVVSLDQLLLRIRRDFPGRILSVELERESGEEGAAWIYEAKILTPQGNVLKLEYDAGSLELLQLEGRHGSDRHEDEDD